MGPVAENEDWKSVYQLDNWQLHDASLGNSFIEDNCIAFNFNLLSSLDLSVRDLRLSSSEIWSAACKLIYPDLV